MPIYEYQCESCQSTLEKIQKIADDPLVECPNCHKDSLKKLVSAPAFRLKGGGWYETDFKSSDKKKNLHEQSKKTSTEKGTSTENSTSTAKSTSVDTPKASPQ